MEKSKSKPVKPIGRLDRASGYIFISPWLIGFLAFTFLPVIISLYLSMTRYDIISPPEFVGFDNFTEIFTTDDRFIKALAATFTYLLSAVPLRLVFSLFVAILLYQGGSRIVSVYRSVLYLPSIIGGSVAVTVMWRKIFGVDGFINAILRQFDLLPQDVNWLGQPSTAMSTLVLLAIWQFGSPMLIFLAGLKQIPDSYYEAAAIDGAGWWSRLFKITLPLLTPIIFFNLLMQLINGFMCFTEAYVLTYGSGSPMDKLLMYVLYLYQKAFKFYQMGYASALAWILLLLMGIFTVIVFRSSNMWVYNESKGE